MIKLDGYFLLVYVTLAAAVGAYTIYLGHV